MPIPENYRVSFEQEACFGFSVLTGGIIEEEMSNEGLEDVLFNSSTIPVVAFMIVVMELCGVVFFSSECGRTENWENRLLCVYWVLVV